MKIPFDPACLAPFIAFLFKLWARSIRYEIDGDWDGFLALNRQAKPLILGLWHGELFPATAFGYSRCDRLVTFVSQSKDGEVIARVIERLGHVTVRGSSSRGGVRALLKAKRIMEKENRIGVITLDGPRGPRHKSKDGVIFLAQRVKGVIVPLRAFPKRAKIFNSWDKFVLPMPFTKCRICLGEPMEVTREKLNPEVMAGERKRLEARMRELGRDHE
ncbi:DUF374 domain-containing protein [Pseudodesulfovibrio cashew]|uniref:DUF374 domain-containing protein n=1 Tax=Pseudodesulfovibrio cashew TaxID=2678688 RepID=A0A6I6JLP9_9BACT|nr:lysophospholipid acyltransferase family protein [Pseudodesulfovibrio cashew]QGY41212.1 DUF374 domain-containing protein [Pseudodesulfovibrio cashew]